MQYYQSFRCGKLSGWITQFGGQDNLTIVPCASGVVERIVCPKLDGFQSREEAEG